MISPSWIMYFVKGIFFMLNKVIKISFVILSLSLAGCDGPKVELTIKGQGTVVSELEGIECGTGQDICVFTFPSEVELITLTAKTLGTDYEFRRWEGACSGTTATCSITEDAVVTAIFNLSCSSSSINAPLYIGCKMFCIYLSTLIIKIVKF